MARHEVDRTGLTIAPGEEALPGHPQVSFELVLRICDRISEGESLRALYPQGSVPDRSSVRRAIYSRRDLESRYLRARELGQHAIAEECREIVDGATPDTVQLARLRVDERHWQMSKLAPRTFGERIQVEDTTPPPTPEQVIDREKALLERITRLMGLISSEQSGG